MNGDLRLSTLGEILDRTAQLYRRNFWLFAGVAALPVGAILATGIIGLALFAAAATAVKTTNLPDAASIPLIALFIFVAIPVYIAACVFSIGGLTHAAASTHRGERPTIRAALLSVRPWFWRYLWLMLLQGILVALIPGAIAGAVIGALIYLIPGGDITTGAAIGFVVFLVAAAAIGVIIWLALSYAMGMAVCVTEQKSAWESLERSWKLSQGTRGRIFVLYLLVVALSIAASMIGYIPFLIIVGVTTAAGNGAQNATAALVVAEIVNFVVNFTMQVLLAPIPWIALVLFYYDQRVRKEGFDIEWMMVQAGLAQLAPAAPVRLSAGISEDTSISGPAAPPDTVEER